MKHTEDRDARRARQAADGFPDFEARSRVKIAQRLVEQEEGRPQGERPGQGHALLLAAGEFLRTAVGPGVGADQAERFEGARLDLRCDQLVRVEGEGRVLEHAEMREERVVLGHEAEPAGGRRREGDVAVIQEHRAALRFLLPGEQLEERGLAAARRPEQAAEGPGLHDEVHPVEDDGGSELTAEAGEAEGGHGPNLGRSPAGAQGRLPTVNAFRADFGFPRLPRGRFRAS